VLGFAPLAALVVVCAAAAAGSSASSSCERIVVVRGPDWASSRVYSLRPDGTDLRFIAGGFYGVWSPDGRQIVVVHVVRRAPHLQTALVVGRRLPGSSACSRSRALPRTCRRGRRIAAPSSSPVSSGRTTAFLAMRQASCGQRTCEAELFAGSRAAPLPDTHGCSYQRRDAAASSSAPSDLPSPIARASRDLIFTSSRTASSVHCSPRRRPTPSGPTLVPRWPFAALLSTRSRDLRNRPAFSEDQAPHQGSERQHARVESRRYADHVRAR
jgi:hypothetical protein